MVALTGVVGNNEGWHVGHIPDFIRSDFDDQGLTIRDRGVLGSCGGLESGETACVLARSNACVAVREVGRSTSSSSLAEAGRHAEGREEGGEDGVVEMHGVGCLVVVGGG